MNCFLREVFPREDSCTCSWYLSDSSLGKLCAPLQWVLSREANRLR